MFKCTECGGLGFEVFGASAEFGICTMKCRNCGASQPARFTVENNRPAPMELFDREALVEANDNDPAETVFTFGKYYNKSVKEIDQFDPDYLSWIIKKVKDQPEIVAATKEYLELQGRA